MGRLISRAMFGAARPLLRIVRRYALGLRRAGAALAVAVAIGLLAAPAAHAQSQAPAAPPAGGQAGAAAIPLADLENLVRTVEDDAARARFIAEIGRAHV